MPISERLASLIESAIGLEEEAKELTGQINAIEEKADLSSPALTGTPTAPTPAPGDDSTKIATTAYVLDAIVAGDPTTASNVGAGDGLFKAKVSQDLQFKTLVAGTNITLTPGTNDITIDATGGSGATQALDNLTTTAINADLVPDTDITRVVGSYAKRFVEAHVQDVIASTVRSQDSAISVNADGRTLTDVSNNPKFGWGNANLSAFNYKINDVADPVDTQDAATKNYVDNAIPAPGANTTLSNLGTTDINAALIFNDAADTTIRTKDNASAPTTGLTIKTGSGIGQDSGGLQIFSGDSNTGASGGVTIFAGSAAAGFAGNIDITGGNGDSGGAATITGGNGNTGEGGAATLRSGDSTSNNSGAAVVRSGNAPGATSGDVLLRTGTGLTRGQVRVMDGSEGTAGQVLMSTDTQGRVAFSSGATLGWQKYTFSYTDFAVAAVDAFVTVKTLAAGEIMEFCVIKHSTQFVSGNGATLVTAKIRFNDTDHSLSGELDVLNAVGTAPSINYTATSMTDSGGLIYSISFSGTDTIDLHLNSDANLDGLTAGDIDVWIKTSKLTL